MNTSQVNAVNLAISLNIVPDGRGQVDEEDESPSGVDGDRARPAVVSAQDGIVRRIVLLLFALFAGIKVVLVNVVVVNVHPGDVDGVCLGARPEEHARDGVNGQVERAEKVLAGALRWGIGIVNA